MGYGGLSPPGEEKSLQLIPEGVRLFQRKERGIIRKISGISGIHCYRPGWEKAHGTQDPQKSGAQVCRVLVHWWGLGRGG